MHRFNAVASRQSFGFHRFFLQHKKQKAKNGRCDVVPERLFMLSSYDVSLYKIITTQYVAILRGDKTTSLLFLI
jgi:hypothetical protein